jgi:hypothetical protein
VSTASGAVAAPSPVSLRAVALPVEHGGWGLLGEPLLLGLLVAPGRAAAGIALLSLAAFLIRHPMKLVLADRRRGARYPRTAAAERFIFIYGALGLLGGLLAWRAPAVTWLPLALGGILGLVQLAYDSRHQGRQLLPELLGAAALGSTAAAILLAGGWSLPAASALWLLLALKAAGSVLYVRTRLRRARGGVGGAAPPIAAHGAALAASVMAAAAGLAPWLAAAAFVWLLARAAQGLSPWAPTLEPRQVGFRELFHGLVATVILTLGYRLGS